MSYRVNLWGSNPDETDNDDCWTGDEFSSKEEALIMFNDPSPLAKVCGSWAYVEIDGPDIHEVRANPNYRPQKDDDDDWKRERAMQAGMAFGCDGYNDEMGY